MMLSLWRYSHFALAAVASIFLLVASVTGVILAFEPITHQSQGYAVHDLDEVSLATTLESLQKKYPEVLALEVETSGFVKASVLTEALETKDLYIDPSTGASLGEVPDRPKIYRFATNLHRSLFLKGLGRFFMGLASFFLLLIAFTGLFLLARRQGGFSRLFSKVHKEYVALRYHVLLSRWMFIPIVVLAVTGVYLSLEKFGYLPQHRPAYSVTSASLTADDVLRPNQIAFFNSLTLDKVRSVQLPFSDAPEEYYQIALQQREIRINQATGAIVGEAPYPLVQLISRGSFVLHTGEGSILWSIILGLASASILFFIYSGCVMSLKRLRKNKVKAGNHPMAEAEYIVLVGSETGSTYGFAKRFCVALEQLGKTVHLTSLNNYGPFPKAQGMVIFASTYGAGDAPANAHNFITQFRHKQPIAPLRFAVVGFGSTCYPDYCSFAIKVDALLRGHKDFIPWMPLTKINDQSNPAFLDWIQEWNTNTGMQLHIEPPELDKTLGPDVPCTVIDRTAINADKTFLLRLRPKGRLSFQSGDLLQIVPPGESIARSYSIANMQGDILLSIKWHTEGKCSSYLMALRKGDQLITKVKKNKGFYFPKKAPKVWMVANGTGLAPFIGMLHEHDTKDMTLTWGGRNQASFEAYRIFLNGSLSNPSTVAFQFAFSCEENRTYVQHLLEQQQEEVAKALEEGCVFMLCGSLNMQRGVMEMLDTISTKELKRPLVHFQNRGQLLMDCY
jgi:sulfite reductase (NADPH) flavoprotein alpha-component